MPTLGISAFYHDSAAALVGDDGTVLAAVQEERFTRKRHDQSFPVHAIRSCLEQAGITPGSLDRVVFYEQPIRKFDRVIDGYLARGFRGRTTFFRTFPEWLLKKVRQPEQILEALRNLDPSVEWSRRLFFSEHHASHAASAFFPSPFDEAVILTMDGVGERATTTIATGSGRDLEIHKEIAYPHSLGLLYSAFTYYTGFRVNSGEYKMMGLAPYGSPRYKDLILNSIIDIRRDGSYWIDPDYFDGFAGEVIINDRFTKLFGMPPRRPEEPITDFYMDVAASIQAVLEEAVLTLCRAIREEFRAKNLCLAGGVALNCVANGKLVREGIFDNIWVQPAAGDAGGSLGAALYGHFVIGKKHRISPREDAMRGAYLGPSFGDDSIESVLKRHRAKYKKFPETELLQTTAKALAGGASVAWFQGAMEFGPRALGARSILADPRRPEMQRMLNLQIKKRESFRPFAPAVLREQLGDWFELEVASPYMLLVADVARVHRRDGEAKDNEKGTLSRLRDVRSDIPAVTHVDCSARVQTLDKSTNGPFYALVERFYAETGCPLLINTSFNVRGEPIVCTPEDAFRCFMTTDLDCLAIGPFFLRKEEQDPTLAFSFARTFEPD